MKMKKWLGITGAMLLGAACAGEEDSPPWQGIDEIAKDKNLALYLTDEPIDIAGVKVDEVLLTVTKIRTTVKTEDVDDDADGTVVDKRNWTVLYDQPFKFNVLDIHEALIKLPEFSIPEGTKKLRLTVSEAMITINGQSHNLEIPGKDNIVQIKFPQGALIKKDGDPHVAVIDIVVRGKINKANEKWVLKPIIRLGYFGKFDRKAKKFSTLEIHPDFRGKKFSKPRANPKTM